MPAHVLVGSAKDRTSCQTIASHVWSGPIPPRSFACISQGLYVSSPEFTFAQLAKELSLIELVYLAYELCGTYPPHAGHIDGGNLTSTRKLLRFLEQCPGIMGRNKAIRAAGFAMDDSASPMESVTAMLLCLPYRLGGYGLPAPILNYRIDIPAGYRSKASKSYFKCDLYWPQIKTALEYDSDKHHTAAEKITEDAIRRNDLEAIGISVMTVTARQVFNGRRLNTLAHALAKPLGRQLRYKNPEFTRKNIELREQLYALLRNSPQLAQHSADPGN